MVRFHRFIRQSGLDSMTLLCASCHERLWTVSLNSHREVTAAPVTIEVPIYDHRIRICPLCEQELGATTGVGEAFLFKTDPDGHIRVFEAERVA